MSKQDNKAVIPSQGAEVASKANLCLNKFLNSASLLKWAYQVL